MTNFPTFFFSHARQDREMPGNYLRRFFEDLQKILAQWAALTDPETKLGTIDLRIEQGNDWDEELSRGLSENRAFLAIITPPYFKRPSCGKEVMAFVRRSPGLGVDQNGALTGVKNVMMIRWMPERAYEENGVKNFRIPQILRRIQDTPADDGSDEEVIKRYQKKGMVSCVDHPVYVELLNLFAKRIYEMQDLPPPVKMISFADTDDAFHYDWKKHFGLVDSSGGPASQETPARPQALSSVVAFYITHRPFTAAPIAVDFADRLIAEPLPGASTSIDPGLAAVLADVRAAGVAEGLTVFHAAADPVLPANSDVLIERLASLSSSRVLTALIIDPEIWPGLGGARDAAAAVELILRSPDWTGPALVPAVDARVTELEKSVAKRGLSRQVAVLPQPSENRVARLRNAFVAMRGGVLRTSVKPAPGAERVPLPSGVGREPG